MHLSIRLVYSFSMRKWILIFLLSSFFPLYSSSFFNFSLIEEKILISCTMTQIASEFSQKNSFKYFQILDFTVHYNGHTHTFHADPVETYGEVRTKINGANTLTIMCYWGPVPEKAVIDSYKCNLSAKEMPVEVKKRLIKPEIF